VCRLDPGEDLLLVVNEDSNDLAVVRVRTQSLLTMIHVGQRPRDIAVKVF
jgi:YVTN family beta-propeller protein